MNQSRTGEVVELALSQLVEGLSPRSLGVDRAHVEALVEVFDLLPPIVVHRGTNLIIDGAHRVAAARLLKRAVVRVLFFEGSEDEAAVEAIRLNVRHGRPLSRDDRSRAVEKLLRAHPEWSDRWLAEVCGVAARRVTKARESLGEDEGTRRLGRDNKLRSQRGAARALAVEAVRNDPTASNRELARRLGVAQGTVRAARDADRVSNQEHRDLAMESTAAKAFVEWLEQTAVDDEEWQHLVDAVPLGRLYEYADECRRRARVWSSLAVQLEARVRRKT